MPNSARPLPRNRQIAIGAYAMIAVVVAVGVLVNSYAWVDRTFPGFFLMANRVVPSVGLTHWTGLQQATSIYQRQVVRLDGRPVASAREVYDAVAAAPPGTVFQYDLASRNVREQRAIASMRFSLRDYISLFGAYFVNGLIFTGVGIAVWILGRTGATRTGAAFVTLASPATRQRRGCPPVLTTAAPQGVRLTGRQEAHVQS